MAENGMDLLPICRWWNPFFHVFPVPWDGLLNARRNRDAATGKRWSRARFCFLRRATFVASVPGWVCPNMAYFFSLLASFREKMMEKCDSESSNHAVPVLKPKSYGWSKSKEIDQKLTITYHSHSVVPIWMITQMYTVSNVHMFYIYICVCVSLSLSLVCL